jgi:quercetin dioxygenase-like cupin family protein
MISNALPRWRGAESLPRRVPAATFSLSLHGAWVVSTSVTFNRWNEVELEQVSPTLSRKLLTGQRMMLAQVFLKKGCVVPRHQHENEQYTYILEGGLRFWIGEDEKEVIDVMAGETLHIPSMVWHKAEALVDTLDLDVFDPPREDWLKKTDEYLRK